MRKHWIFGGLLIATGLAGWQIAAFAQPPRDRPEARDEERRPPRPPRPPQEDRAEERVVREESLRIEHDRRNAERDADQLQAKLRAAEDSLRRLREKGAEEEAVDIAEMALRQVGEQMRKAAEQGRRAEEQARRMHEEFGLMHERMERPGEVHREINIIHGPAMGGVPGPGMPPERIPMSHEERERLEEFRKLIHKYRQTKDNEKREELKDDIRAQLAEQLDMDLKRREEQVEGMEKRVIKLRSQVEKARESKDETVNSLLDMLDNSHNPVGISPAWMDAIQQSSSNMKRPLQFEFRAPDMFEGFVDKVVPRINMEITKDGDVLMGGRMNPPPPPPHPDAWHEHRSHDDASAEGETEYGGEIDLNEEDIDEEREVESTEEEQEEQEEEANDDESSEESEGDDSESDSELESESDDEESEVEDDDEVSSEDSQDEPSESEEDSEAQEDNV